jgi:hypothetical protein
MKHAYLINETGAGDWSDVKDLGKRKNILAAISKFNKHHSYSISTDTDETDFYYWRGSKYGIHSCYENDGRNGILVAVVFSKVSLLEKTVRKLVDSYYYCEGPEWNKLFAKLQADSKVAKLLEEKASGEELELLKGIIIEDIECMTPYEILEPCYFPRLKRIILKELRK